MKKTFLESLWIWMSKKGLRIFIFMVLDSIYFVFMIYMTYMLH